jgi:hypothetical protein
MKSWEIDMNVMFDLEKQVMNSIIFNKLIYLN